MNQRGFITIALGIAVVLLAGALGFVLYTNGPNNTNSYLGSLSNLEPFSYGQRNQNSIVDVPNVVRVPSDAGSNDAFLKTYSNAQLGFSFLYPASWSIEESREPSWPNYLSLIFRSSNRQLGEILVNNPGQGFPSVGEPVQRVATDPIVIGGVVNATFIVEDGKTVDGSKNIRQVLIAAQGGLSFEYGNNHYFISFSPEIGTNETEQIRALVSSITFTPWK